MALANEADGAHEPFLEKSSGREGVSDVSGHDSGLNTNPSLQAPGRRPRSYTGMPAGHVLFHVGLVAVYTFLSALTIYALRHDPTLTGGQKYASPAWLPEVQLKPSPAIFNSDASPFAPPASNATIDNAWSSLLTPINMRATDDELILSGVRSSVKLASTGKQNPEANNLVWLDAFHELRCLDLLRRAVHSTPEVAGQSMPNSLGNIVQIDQCIETLRQSIMCQPDLTLTGLIQTSPNSRMAPDTRKRIKECVDWDALVESLESRVVDVEDVLS